MPLALSVCLNVILYASSRSPSNVLRNKGIPVTGDCFHFINGGSANGFIAQVNPAVEPVENQGLSNKDYQDYLQKKRCRG